MNEYQNQIKAWMQKCFEYDVINCPSERNFRFLEEALELVQACDCDKEMAHAIVDYVFDRPPGIKDQEVGGVMITLAALCNVQTIDYVRAGWKEFDRINRPEIIQKIRDKHVTKDIRSSLAKAT